MPVSFWDRFFDSEYRQRTDIGALQDQEMTVASDLGAQAHRIDRLQTQVNELSLTVAVLMRVLSELGQLDPQAIRLRVEAELEALRPPAPRPVDAKPVKAKPPEFTVQCSRCGAKVPSTHTTITEAGTMCEKCAP